MNNTNNTNNELVIHRMICGAKNKLKNIKQKNNLERLLDQAICDIDTNRKKFNEIYGIIHWTFEKEECEREKKTKDVCYVEPPSFDTAVLDFLKCYIPDIVNMPEQEEFLSAINFKESFPDTTTWVNKKNENINKPKLVFETEIKLIKKRMLQITGSTQTQKTNYIIGLAVKSMLKANTPVIVTRDIIDDARQLEKRVNEFSISFNEYMNKHDVQNRRFEITTVRADNLNDKAIASFSGKMPTIIISLGNETQIPNVVNMIKDVTTLTFIPKVDIMIDENDKVDYSVGSQTYEALNNLKELTHQEFGITATSLDVLYMRDELRSADFFRLTDPIDYRGHHDFMVKLLELDPNVYGCNKEATYENVHDLDINFRPFLNYFATLKPDWIWDMSQYLPSICLIKNTNNNSTQEAIYYGINKEYKECKLITLILNEKGIMINIDCEINGNKIKANTFVKGIDIPDWLQYLKKNGGVKKYSRIIIIAGYKAERCISFVSRDYAWHLTDMYYNPAKSTSVPTMIQETGRLSGRNKNKAHLHLHCTIRVSEALYKGLRFTTEVINRSIYKPLIIEGEEQGLFKSILSQKMTNKKFPKYRKIVHNKKVKRCDFNLVKGYDGGLKIEEYNVPLYKGKIENKVQDNDEIKNSREEIGDEEFNRLVIMFQKWTTNTTKISAFMHNLDPKKVYTEIEFKEFISPLFGITNINMVLKYNVGAKSRGFGCIIQKKNKTYRLHPCLISEFSKYF